MASQEELDRLKELRDLERELAGIRSDTLNDVRDMSNFLSDSAASLKLQVAERNQIRSISRQINKIAQESYTISLSELGTSKNLAKIQGDRESLQKKIASLTQLQETLSKSENENQKNIAENISFQVEETQKLLAELKEVEEESSRIKSNLGVRGFAVAEDIAGAIPGLRQFKGTFSDAANAARGIAASGGNAAQAFAAGAKSIGKSAAAALPLLIFTEIVKAFIQIDNSSGKIAKNLGISYNEAIGLNREFNSIASSSDNIFVTTESLGESFLAINNALGTNSTLSGDLLVTQTELVKQAGYSVEAATQLSTLSLATGQSSKDITTEFLGQLTLLNLQNKSSLNEKQLLESISKTSKGTLATFASQPKELARAVFEAKKLGLNLSQVEKVADGLLDIESSLTAEFEAEVITGKQLNLERARYFALTNDLAGVAKELAAQDITRASFAKANRIEQDAIAASLGMSRDEMGEMLLEQEALTKLSGIEGATAQARFDNLVKEVGLEEAKRQIGDNTLSNQLASVSAQERFAQSISKLQDLFVTLIDPLLPVLDVFGQIFSLIGGIVKLLNPLIKSVGVIVSAFSFNDATFQSALDAQAKSIEDDWGLSSKKMFTSVEDGIAPASKGPFTITDSYGATAITSKGDGLAVSPNIRREGRNDSAPIDYEKLANAIAKGAERGTSRATVVTNLDGDRISTRLQPSLAVNTRRYSV
jgi:hypothetical protein